MTATEVVAEIVRANPRIYSMCFRVYKPSKNLTEEAEDNPSVDRMIHHNDPSRELVINLMRHEITVKRLDEIINRLTEKEALVVTSSIVYLPSSLGLSEGSVQIPMMDFKCEPSSENLEKVKEFLKKTVKVMPWGAVLLAGRSYHYYGTELLTEKEWLTFLANCLLFSGYVDHRYIGHRLLDHCMALRMSWNLLRPQTPKVVAVLP